MKFTLKFTLIVAAGFLAVASTSVIAKTNAQILESLSLPRNATLELVAGNAVHNGASMAMGAFSAPLNREDALAFFRSLWAEGYEQNMPGFLESDMPGWQLVSRLEGKVLTVVQLSKEPLHSSAGQTSTGFISVRRVEAVASRDSRPEFSDLELLSSNKTRDGVDTSTINVYASRLSVARSHDHYKRRLKSAGWSLVSDVPVDGEQVSVFSRKATRLEITFVNSREVGSVMVVHEVLSQ